MKTTNFRLEATMRSAAIIQGALTLESLLAAAVHEATGSIREDALAHVPIETLDAGGAALWQASSVFYDGVVRRGRETIIRRRRNTEMGPDFYAPNPRIRKGDPFAIDQARGDFKALLNSYPTVQADKLVWFARGDAAQCSEMLRSLMFIGKRRGQGFGEIAGVAVYEVDENPLVTACGMVRRPVPVEQLPFVRGAAAQSAQHLARVSAQHPAWAHPPVLCAVPADLELRRMSRSGDDESFCEEVFFE